MAHIRERDVAGSGSSPVQLKHLVAPWTLGSKTLWLGVAVLEPGASTRAHAIDGIEAVHVTLEGHGTEVVAGERIETAPGTYVLIPPGAEHQILNTGDGPLKVLSVTSPPIARPA